MKIAIVSFEFEGLTKNGGIGTAYRRLAELLVKNGHDVSVLFVPFQDKIANKAKKVASMRRKGIKVLLPADGKKLFHTIYDDYHQRRALLVYECLKKNNFDLVHAADNCGLVYFALLAKKAQLHFSQTNFVIGTHGSPIWAATANGEYTADAISLSDYDRCSIAMADHLVSPSQYMLDYLKSISWKTPKTSFVLPNVNLFTVRKNKNKKFRQQQKTLVFFGRLEKRKGIFIFADALMKLIYDNHSIGKKRRLKVVFLGSEPGTINRFTTTAVIKRRLAYLEDRVQFVFKSNLSSEESLNYLSDSEPKLVCMPSLVDNSPYVVVEALERRLDFLATNMGGQAELIDKRDHQAVLVAPDAKLWAHAIAKRLNNDRYVARASKQVLSANRAWAKFHRTLKYKTQKSSPRTSAPLVSILLDVLPSGDSHAQLRTYSSILKQTYNKIEICLSKKNPQRVLFEKEGFDVRPVGEDVLQAAKKAKGKYLIFLDGAELFSANTLAGWVRAAELMQREQKKNIAVSGVNVSLLNHVIREEWSVPVPETLERAIAGQCLANTYALWNRKNFLKVASKKSFQAEHDLLLRPFVSEALAKKMQFSTYPDRVVNSLIPDWSRFWVPQSDTSFLDPLLKSRSRENIAILYALAGSERQLKQFRHAYYLECEKNSGAKT